MDVKEDIITTVINRMQAVLDGGQCEELRNKKQKFLIYKEPERI